MPDHAAGGRIIVSATTRAHIYRVLVTLVPVVVFYGIASQNEAALWLAVAAALLGNGLAAANTSSKP